MPKCMDLHEYKAASSYLYEICASADQATRDDGYAELLNWLMYHARKLASRYNVVGREYLVDECCANAIVSIIKHFGQCRGADSFLGWCRQTLRNEYLAILEHEGFYCPRPHQEDADALRESRTYHARPANMTSLDEPQDDNSDNPRAESIQDIGAGTEGPALSEMWIRWVLKQLADTPYMTDQSKRVLLDGYLRQLDDEELGRALHVTRKNITVIRARDRASLKRNDPKLVAEIGRLGM